MSKAFLIRAKAYKEGYSPSVTVSRTYFIDPEGRSMNQLPVISIITPEKYLFDYDDGIYTPGVDFDTWREENPGLSTDGGRPANYHRRGAEWEYPAHLSFWDAGSVHPDLAQDIGFRIHGGWSRSFPMKSLRLYARSIYGNSTLDYPFFTGCDYDSFKRLILRNSGNDWFEVMFRDAFIQGLNSHLLMDTQAYRPVVLFLNGEYWGIHNIRERYDKHYLERVYGVHEDSIDLLTHNAVVKEGDNIHYNETLDYIREHGVSEDVHYSYIKTRIDTDNFIDYQIANIYAVNTDWPGNNIDFWRKRTTGYEPDSRYGHDGRWRWLAFDMDFGFALHSNPAHNTLEFATQQGQSSWPNPDWSTFLLRELLKNKDFERDFINRFADLLNTSYRPQWVDQLITVYMERLQPEIDEHIQRWSAPSSFGHWHQLVNNMRNFASERYVRKWGHLADFFSLADTALVTVDVSGFEHGYVRVNSTDIHGLTPGVDNVAYPWSGYYFEGVEIRLEAVPGKGYVFSHWEIMDKEQAEWTMAGQGAVIFADPAGRPVYRANFLPEDDREIVHYWHFNTLDGSGPVEMVMSDFSRLESGYIIYGGSGEGYMDMVREGSGMNLSFGQPPGYCLRVRNPSCDRELIINTPTTGFENISLDFAVRRTPNGAEIQSIYVSANAGESWSELAHELNEAIAENYEIEESWQHLSFDLSGMDSLEDNENVRFRILFSGDNACGDSGNNRFDNISLRGIRIEKETIYFSNDSGKLHELSTWGSNTDGSGDNPSSFEQDAAIYVITNRDSIELSANWAISGEGSRLVAGKGNSGLYFRIPPEYHFSGILDVSDKAEVVLENTILPDIQLIAPGSVIVFGQQEHVVIPTAVYGSLVAKGIKEMSGSYTVLNTFRLEDATVNFQSTSHLSLMGDIVYSGSIETLAPHNVNMVINGDGDQLILSEEGNIIEAYNFYIEKSGGHLSLESDIFALNNLRIELNGDASFSDGGHQLRLNDDLRLKGEAGKFQLTGSILLTAGSGTNDFELNSIRLNDLFIDVDGDARPDFALAGDVISIAGDLSIRSRSERPVRLRDKVFQLSGDLIIDVDTPERIEEDRSIIWFLSEKRQEILNHTYDGQGMLQNIKVDNPAGLEIGQGNITVDGFLHIDRGLVYSSYGSMPRLGPFAEISVNNDGGSYVKGPLGIYDSGNGREMNFIIGDSEGIRPVYISLERDDNMPVLYIAEYFREAAPNFPLSADVEKLVEGAGYHSVIAYGEDSQIEWGRVMIPYTGFEELKGEICIALLRDDEWISVGDGYPEDMPGYISSSLGFESVGLFALARGTETLNTEFPGSAAEGLQVFPNPVAAGGEIITNSPDEISVYNTMGKPLMTSSGANRISTAGLAPGVYILRDARGNSTRLVIL